MSVATAYSEGLTIADLEAMPDDGRRYELVGGAIVVTPTPVPLHQRVSCRLLRLLDDACPAGHEVFCALIDLDLPGGQRVVPDLVVVEASSVGEKRLTTPVLLVVEIVSGGSRTHDRVTRVAAYAEAAVPAYWIVDPLAGRITALRLVDGSYESYDEGSAIDVDCRWPSAPASTSCRRRSRRFLRGPQWDRVRRVPGHGLVDDDTAADQKAAASSMSSWSWARVARSNTGLISLSHDEADIPSPSRRAGASPRCSGGRRLLHHQPVGRAPSGRGRPGGRARTRCRRQGDPRGYRRCPPGAGDEWGDPEKQALAAALLNAKRLDAEDGGW